MNRKKVAPIAIAALVLIAIAGWYWHSHSSANDQNQLTLYGNVDIHQVSLDFNASERIAELKVREGDKVIKDDVLGVLDDRTFKLRLAQTEAQMNVQEQVLQRLKTGSRPEEIAQAKARVTAAEADADQASKQVTRLKAANEATGGKGVSVQDMDAAIARQKVALAQAESARKAAQIVVTGPRKEDIAQAESLLAAAKAEHALIQRQLDESQLRAPIDAGGGGRLSWPHALPQPRLRRALRRARRRPARL